MFHIDLYLKINDVYGDDIADSLAPIVFQAENELFYDVDKIQKLIDNSSENTGTLKRKFQLK